jgi:hypothetical protein
MNRFHEIELEKAYDLILTIENMRIQVGIFFATVNLGVLSYGVVQAKVMFFLFAALLFWAMIVIDDAARKMLTHYYYRVAHLHKKYVRGDNTFSPNTFSRLANEIKTIASMKTDSERLVALKYLPLKRRNLYGFWLPVMASMIELAAGLYLWKVLGWTII